MVLTKVITVIWNDWGIQFLLLQAKAIMSAILISIQNPFLPSPTKPE